MICRALNCQRWGIALLALLPTLNAPPAAASPIYSLIELGNFGGDTFAWGINNSGQVSGYSYDTSVGQNRAFLYGAGVTTNLGTIGAPSNYSIGFAINDAGQVAGGTTSSTYGPLVSRGEGVVWSEGTSTVLPTLGGYEDEPGFGAALGINNSGQVTGTSSNGVANHSHALLYSNGTITDLGTLGGPNSEGRAINDRGEVAGGAGLSFSNTGLAHAYIYSGGFMTDLGTLGGLESIAFGINNLGQVVGGSRTLRGDIIAAFLRKP